MKFTEEDEEELPLHARRKLKTKPKKTKRTQKTEEDDTCMTLSSSHSGISPNLHASREGQASQVACCR